LAKQGKKDLPGKAAAGGEVERDDCALLTEDDLACCSWWRQVWQLKEDRLNGGPAICVASARKRNLLL
jgi:hypothetical protein